MLFYLQHPAKPSHHCPPCPVPTLEVTPSTEWCWTWNFLSEQTWLGWAALNWSQLYLSHIQRTTKIHRRRVQQVSPHLNSGPSVTKQALWYQYWLQKFLPLLLSFLAHSFIVLYAFSSVMASVCRVLLWTRPVTFPESKPENINFNHVCSTQTVDPIRQIMEKRDSNIQTLVHE